ncbi:hypothetical protein E2542_SST24010 [Spatholobus suberectus]|nr:hypothetical protein E2542_SST24010 [Spatholobus suberectus]
MKKNQSKHGIKGHTSCRIVNGVAKHAIFQTGMVGSVSPLQHLAQLKYYIYYQMKLFSKMASNLTPDLILENSSPSLSTRMPVYSCKLRYGEEIKRE